MKKKTLGRITALGLAALTAVPTFSIVASAAEMSFPALYEVTYTEAVGGNAYVRTEYYDTKAAADARAENVMYNGAHPKATLVSNIAAVFSATNNKFDYNNGQVIPNASGTITYRAYSGSSTGTGRIDTVPEPYRYATDYYYVVSGGGSGRVYPNLDMLRYVEGNVSYEPVLITLTPYSTSTPYFNYTQGTYSETSTEGSTIYIYRKGSSITYSISSYNRYASNTVYVYNGVCYPNYDSMVSTVGNVTGYTTRSVESGYTYTSERCYFDPASGRYYTYYNKPSTAVSVSAAKTGNYTVYYSSYTGRYYDTLSAANAATPSGYTVRTITNSAYTASYLNTYGYGYGYYGYYDGYYDPNYYYYYYLSGNNGLTNTTTATKDTSTVTIGKYTGWTNVIKVINAARSGASYAVNMKSETEIPENVLKAMKGKNVNILFTYSNGSVITINGNDITSTTAFSPTVRYGSTSIPSSLKKKAVKSNSGVSSSQFTINGGSFGTEVSVTVKFNSKRSGCSAKLYRYNSSANTLSLVSRSAVQSNGQCKFDDVKQGGEYIVVLS